MVPILPSVAKWEADNNPRSFPETEAETPISKPPYAQKCSRGRQLFVYSARFTNPVKTISSAALIKSLALVAVNPYNQAHYVNRLTYR
jgi:hypothetical protein